MSSEPRGTDTPTEPMAAERDEPKFEYGIQIYWPGEGGRDTRRGWCGPRALAKKLREKADLIDQVYPPENAVGERVVRDQRDQLAARIAKAVYLLNDFAAGAYSTPEEGRALLDGIRAALSAEGAQTNAE